jgi:hypothetical protein
MMERGRSAKGLRWRRAGVGVVFVRQGGRPPRAADGAKVVQFCSGRKKGRPNMKSRIWYAGVLAACAVASLPTAWGAPVGTAFIYQGQLNNSGVPVQGATDFKFSLWDAAAAGTQIGATLTLDGQGGNPSPPSLVNGLFTVSLDFGVGAYNGNARWLEIAVRYPSGTGSYTTLSGRQELKAAPYAMYALTAAAVPGGVTGSGTAGTIPKFATASSIGNSIITESGGRIGVGIATPSAKLHIGGTSGTDGLKFPDGSLQISSAWHLIGNSGTSPGTNFVGTTDNQPLELKVNGARALRLEPGTCPNVIGGFSGNSVASGTIGAAIGGGGGGGVANTISGNFGTIGGGRFQSVSSTYATIAGGDGNSASASYGAIGGGSGNWVTGQFGTVGGGTNNGATSWEATVGGGIGNLASGNDSTVAGGIGNQAGPATTTTVGGGAYNYAQGDTATVAGGGANYARGDKSTVGGGWDNQANGDWSTIPGGKDNIAEGDRSLAAGYRAQANHDGCFVWGDWTESDFASTASNQFLIRASGGVGINTNAPSEALHVVGNAKIVGSVVQSDGGPGIGVMTVLTTSGYLDASGDFTLTIPQSAYYVWQADNYVFKVELYISIDPTSLFPHSNRGSAYQMEIVGKERGASLTHFTEVTKVANDATFTFTYSVSGTDLQVAVNTNRASGKEYRATIKISH